IDPFEIERALRVAHDVERARLDREHTARVVADERRALRPELARVPALQVAGEHGPGFCAHALAAMDVAERPVVVTLAFQLIERARRIRLVTGAAIDRGVE